MALVGNSKTSQHTVLKNIAWTQDRGNKNTLDSNCIQLPSWKVLLINKKIA